MAGLGLVVALLCGAPARGAAVKPVDFNFEIRPLLSDRCFACHGPDEKARKKKLRLDTREGIFKVLDDDWAIVSPGEPDRSELVRRLLSTDEDEVMPPPQAMRQLSLAERELFQRWVAEGAEFKPHWSLIPVAPVTPPSPHGTPAPTNAVDAFVRARLESEGLAPAPEAAPAALLRRLAFDLTGLPPTEAELAEITSDPSPAAYQKAMDRYLASPAYGERMALDWLDLARYADTYGYQADVETDLSPWRDWVIRSFNENLPYDQFLVWQLAGDLLPNPTHDQRLATAFNRLHRQTNEGGSVEEEFRAEYVSDRVNTFGTAVLGMALGCARCHDHKYDPISQRDYYSLGAFFNSIDESGLYAHFTRAIPTPTLFLWGEGKEAEAAALAKRIREAGAGLEAIRRGADKDFEAWRGAGGTPVPAEPIARFPLDTVTNDTTPDVINAGQTAHLGDGPRLVPGHEGNALEFSGDNEMVCGSVRNFRRADPFSLSVWVRPSERQERAVVLHQSRAWTDSGSRGFELVLDHGRPFFGLIHFWPGDAAAVLARQALPTNEWTQVTVTYDGSGRAAGIHLYLNGLAAETGVVRDHLVKDIIHRGEWGDAEAGSVRLTLGARFRDNGFRNGRLDDLRVYDVELTAAEARALAGAGDGGAAAAREWFVARKCEPYRAALAELQTLRRRHGALVDDTREIMTMEEMPQPRPAFVLRRGAYDAPGDAVTRDTPRSILPFPADQPRNRLGLARWVVDRKNPLTARVVVNRIWRMHFGRGLVATEADFGSQGKLPSHPELLEWLAGWFMDHGWDVKALHRLLVTSETYRQSSVAAKALRERDPENILLARGPQRRLPAELIRDSALAASGLLNRTVGGPSVKPYQPAGLWEQSGTGKSYSQDHGDKLYRRSLYTFWRRTSPPPSMLAFDAVTREVCTASRENTSTPLQALVLLDDPQFIEASRVLAGRLLKAYPADTDQDARARAAFRALAAREPDHRERAILRQLFDEQKAAYARDNTAAEKLLGIGESPWNHDLPRADYAALTVLVNTVMNFDEFVMLR